MIRFFLVFVLCLSSSGCTFFKQEEHSNENHYVFEETVEDLQKRKKKQNRKKQDVQNVTLYLVDQHGFVVPQSHELPRQEAVAKQAVEYLVIDGPITNHLPKGFRAVLPEGTEVSVDLQGKQAIIDFSKEFMNYQKEDEGKILESITWTMTQFPSIDSVQINVQGNKLTAMPKTKRPIPAHLTRDIGINLDVEAVDIAATKPITAYFLSQHEDKNYFVPITKRVPVSVDEIQATIQLLKDGPGHLQHVVSVIQGDIQLLDKPVISNGNIRLNFDPSILDENKSISKEVIDAITLSMTEQKNIQSVSIQVNSSFDVKTHPKVDLHQPVIRHVKINPQ